MDKEFLKMLACPWCKAAVEKQEDKLVCTYCKREYQIIDGIPVMIVEEA